MFLKSLEIRNDSGTIRDIQFHQGLNLIIDETSSDNKQDSGNNVGKTTVLRLIDFCLAGKGDNIYNDPKFKSKSNNTIVEKFLKENSLLVILILQEDLNNENCRKIEIRRNFKNYKEKIQTINGEKFSKEEFKKQLEKLIFKTDVDKPTFRQMIAKNIRYENERLDNAIKVLHNTSTFEDYEGLYLFWFNIDTDSGTRKQRLQNLKTSEEALLKRLRKDSTQSEIEQTLLVLERDIKELDQKKAKFSVNEDYEKDLATLNIIKNSINSISLNINRLNLRKRLIEESKAELEKEFANIDTDQLQNIYALANGLIPDLQKKFEELLAFHNTMLQEKIKFISEEYPQLLSELKSLTLELIEEVKNEKFLTEKLNKSGAMEELEALVTKLNVKFEQKGRYEQQLKQWKESHTRLESFEKELREINDGIETLSTELDDKIADFNKYFSKISEKLYDEQFILSKDSNDRAFELKITTIGGNLGTGKKKGQIAAFDFAYIQFCDAHEIPCLHFLLYDQVETIHDNQLNLIAEIANESNAQFIFPVLRDKLPADLEYAPLTVVTLSQSEKLFRL